MKNFLLAVACAAIVGCATLTEDAMTPIALSFSDGTEGECKLSNKRGAWPTSIPATVTVRKSDDPLKYDCVSEDGRKAYGSIASEMGGKIIASAVFIDLGITDAITDKHRRYADSFVIPLPRTKAIAAAVPIGDSEPAANDAAPVADQSAPITEK